MKTKMYLRKQSENSSSELIPLMSNITIRPYSETDLNSIVSLWEICELSRPWNDPVKDIERKLTVQRELFLILEKNGEILGSVMGGYDGHRGSVNYLGIHPDHKNEGLGKLLMNRIEEELIKMGCPKINLMVRNSNLDVHEFYRVIGYEEQEVVVFGKRLIPDE